MFQPEQELATRVVQGKVVANRIRGKLEGSIGGICRLSVGRSEKQRIRVVESES